MLYFSLDSSATMLKKRKSTADTALPESNPSKLHKPDVPATQSDDMKHRPTGRLDKVRSVMPQGLNMSRKELRKEMRQLKKSRRNAYNRKEKASLLFNFFKYHPIHFNS